MFKQRFLLKWVGFFFGLFVGLNSLHALAQDPLEKDFQAWAVTSLAIPLPQKMTLTLDAQPRWQENWREFDRVLATATLTYPLTEHISISQGYTWRGKQHPEFTSEHRPWQQLQFQWQQKRLTLSQRLRVEERFFDNTNGLTLRGRSQTRGSLTLDAQKKWAWILSDEVFWTMANADNGQKSGFEQNRLYTGIQRRLNPHTAVEAGYLLQYLNPRGLSTHALRHVLQVSLNLTL